MSKHETSDDPKLVMLREDSEEIERRWIEDRVRGYRGPIRFVARLLIARSMRREQEELDAEKEAENKAAEAKRRDARPVPANGSDPRFFEQAYRTIQGPFVTGKGGILGLRDRLWVREGVAVSTTGRIPTEGGTQEAVAFMVPHAGDQSKEWKLTIVQRNRGGSVLTGTDGTNRFSMDSHLTLAPNDEGERVAQMRALDTFSQEALGMTYPIRDYGDSWNVMPRSVAKLENITVTDTTAE